MTCSKTHGSLDKWDFICVSWQNPQAWQSRAWAVALGSSQEAVLSLCLLSCPAILQAPAFVLRFPLLHAGEGNANPPQSSYLENPMGRGAWWATVHGVTKSRTRRNDLTTRHPQNTFGFCTSQPQVCTVYGGRGREVRAAGLPWAPFHQRFLPLLACCVSACACLCLWWLGGRVGEVV